VIDNRLIVSATTSAPTHSHGHTTCPYKPPCTHPFPIIVPPSKAQTFWASLEPLDPDQPPTPAHMAPKPTTLQIKPLPTTDGYFGFNW